MKKKTSRNGELVIEINGFVALVVAIVLVIAVVITALIFIFMPRDKDEDDGRDKAAMTTVDDSPSTPAGSNTTPLFPTNETRDSYKIGTSSSLITLLDDSFIASNNTILVKLDEDRMESIVEKNADAKIYPASMTKVMTLIVACERVTDLSVMLTVDAEAVRYMSEQGGSGVGLRAGESYTVEDLIYLISYQSDTIAAILIAEHIAGSEEAFVELMNQKAEELGLTGTHFANCTGLHNENNYTTCREMASIMAYALDNEFAYKCLSSYVGRPMTVGGTACRFYSAWFSERFKDNPRLGTVTVKAAKTGYIDESGICLVSYATSADGEKYINVIVGKPYGSGLNESKSTAEVKKIYNTYAK